MKSGNRRRLKLEGLEVRQCFASDGLATDLGALLASLGVSEDVVAIVRHNYQQPTDVNVDGHTTPMDALSVINELNQQSSPNDSGEIPDAMSATMSDTNGDRLVSPLDALVVINYLNLQSSGTANIVETDASTEVSPENSRQFEDLIRQLLADLGSAEEMIPSVDLASIDLGTRDTTGGFGLLGGLTYDPTDDNGNGYFLPAEDAKPLSTTIEAELRKQLKLDESATIKVAVFASEGEVRSGTWTYLTEEGTRLWGNWRYPTQSPEQLRLFLSNVEEENRIYGQYPNGSMLYFSWLDDEPVGFYFTPIGRSAVENPVPIERYTDYFAQVPGAEAYDSELYGIDAFAGDFGAFDGAQPIEKLLSELYAIQRTWIDELAASVN